MNTSRWSVWSLAAVIAAVISAAFAALPQQSGAPAKRPQASRPAPAAPLPARDKPAEAIRLNNLGVAYMNQQRMERALQLFEQAGALDPNLFVARLNHGIALLNLQRIEPARALLLAAVQQQPGSARAWYNLGLLHKNAGDAAPALEAFQQAAKLAPEDADTHYFAGLLLTQLQQYPEAITALERALKLNPFHASAEFGLSRAYQRSADPEKARAHLARFQKLTQEKLGTPMGLAYGDQGSLSLAQSALPPGGAPLRPGVPVKFVTVPPDISGLRLAIREPLVQPSSNETSPRASAACFLDLDDDGHPDLFLSIAGDKFPGRLFRNSRGRFSDISEAWRVLELGSPHVCVGGDYDADGKVDLLTGGVLGPALSRNMGGGVFENVTEQTLKEGRDFLFDMVFLDYDHDGDLDVYAVQAKNVLWRNNGNGTFTRWTEPAGLEGIEGNVQAAFWDFNNDRAIDLILTSLKSPPVILANPREGRFQRFQLSDIPPAQAVTVLDFDKDGWMDLAFAHKGESPLTLWRNVQGMRFERVHPPVTNWSWAERVASVDFDNDGWLDLVATGVTLTGGRQMGRLKVLRNAGGAGFEDVTSSVGLDSLEMSGAWTVQPADYDSDGDSDLLVLHSGPPILLRNDGGNKNNWLKLSLRGLADNKSAIGAKVEVFAGASYQKFEVTSPNDLIIGLGQEKQADVVRLLWPTGVLQDEVELAANKRHVITEIDRRGSSCPILFAWNGTRYEFIADAIGPGIIGHWVAPGQRNVSDPTEYIKVPGSSLRAKNGRLSFRFAEPMEELVYLDQLRLFAVDHPADVDIYPNERFYASGPPFPEFKIIASRAARLPRGAWDHRGRNVLSELEARDRRYVTGFADAPFKGFAAMHHLELELPQTYQAGPLRLLAHGFTDYFTATSVYAAHQAGVTAIVPYVEAQNAAGEWQRVVNDMGFPAGLARTMIADLSGKLPAGTRRIRIVTNLKVYWDQILIDTTPDMPAGLRVSEAPLAAATLSYRGYPREVRGTPPGDIRYVYEEVSQTGPYARPAGSYTRYGDVGMLLEKAEDRFVIFGSGEEVALEFDSARLPSLPDGWSRDYLFYVDGFAKDMDFYAAHGDTVEPLPHHRMGRYPTADANAYPAAGAFLNYRLDFNTRQVSGRPPASLRFEFRSPQDNKQRKRPSE